MPGQPLNLILPENYHSPLSLKETETGIKMIKDYFEKELARVLNLARVSAPLFVKTDTGVNDNLNGIEKPVSFKSAFVKNHEMEIVHSLAKWKRIALARYKFEEGEGLYTDMNAIRKDEELDNLHSMYVDQWDWELILHSGQREISTLKNIVNKIYNTMKSCELYIVKKFPSLEAILPDTISFISTYELEKIYPGLTPKEREDAICRERGAVFIMQIGDLLESGEKHDGRAPDYDDWTLNGDIVLWYPVLDRSFEISSMGIRVDGDALLRQLKMSNCEDRLNLEYHRALMSQKLPQTIGGGIGQSRLCMYFLKKAHIGEVQSSIWPDDMIRVCEEKNIILL